MIMSGLLKVFQRIAFIEPVNFSLENLTTSSANHQIHVICINFFLSRKVSQRYSFDRQIGCHFENIETPPFKE